MSLRRKIGNFWYRFRIGYSVYLAFPLSFISLIVTVYYLAIPNLPFLESIFPSFEIFTIIMILLMIPIGYELGVLHFSRRSRLYRQESVMATLMNPYNTELLVPVWVPAFEALSDIARAMNLNNSADKIDETLKKSKAAYAKDGVK